MEKKLVVHIIISLKYRKKRIIYCYNYAILLTFSLHQFVPYFCSQCLMAYLKEKNRSVKKSTVLPSAEN